MSAIQETPGRPQRPCPRPNATIFHRERKEAFAALCNSYACTNCGSRKRDRLARRGAALGADGMLTTTISDRWSHGLDAYSPVAACTYLRARERVFRHHITRVIGKFAYLAVFELGEETHRGHQHYLVRWRNRGLVSGHRRGVLPVWMLRKLQRFAKGAGLGRIDWLPLSDSQGAARYVAKYVSKSIGENADGFPSRFRRFTSNESYEEPHEEGWQYSPFPVDLMLETLRPRPSSAPDKVIWLLPATYLPAHPN